MFEVLFLGTSAAAPSIQRGLSALVVQHNDFHFLVDCGEGTLRQLIKSGSGFTNLNRILLTHGHLDHILGLAGLVSMMADEGKPQELEIWGGAFTLERVRTLINDVAFPGAQPTLPIRLREITPGKIFETNDLQVTAFPVTHRGSGCFGYIFESQPLLVEEAGSPPPGVKLVIVGDAGRTDNLTNIAHNADALVIEATYTEAEVDMAHRFSHLTAREAAELASRAGVKKLILTHLSRRYQTKEILSEARTTFSNVVVAQDFDRFSIR